MMMMYKIPMHISTRSALNSESFDTPVKQQRKTEEGKDTKSGSSSEGSGDGKGSGDNAGTCRCLLRFDICLHDLLMVIYLLFFICLLFYLYTFV